MQEISYCNLETGRYGPKSGVSGLSGRVDSTVYMWNVNQLMLLICIRLRGSERRDQSFYKNSKNFLNNS